MQHDIQELCRVVLHTAIYIYTVIIIILCTGCQKYTVPTNLLQLLDNIENKMKDTVVEVHVYT